MSLFTELKNPEPCSTCSCLIEPWCSTISCIGMHWKSTSEYRWSQPTTVLVGLSTSLLINGELVHACSAAREKPCPHLMMSMWPFLAAWCRGLVLLGSVVSPGLGSSKAALMLLLSSSWTTCAEANTTMTSLPQPRVITTGLEHSGTYYGCWEKWYRSVACVKQLTVWWQGNQSGKQQNNTGLLEMVLC